jgi:hypothetical protein
MMKRHQSSHERGQLSGHFYSVMSAFERLPAAHSSQQFSLRTLTRESPLKQLQTLRSN